MAFVKQSQGQTGMRCEMSQSVDFGRRMTAFGERLSDGEMNIFQGNERERKVMKMRENN